MLGLSLNFYNYIEQVHLTDIWWKENPTQRDYTSFLSKRHLTYSSIDYIMVSEGVEAALSSPIIGVCVLLDHAPASVDWKVESNCPWSRNW